MNTWNRTFWRDLGERTGATAIYGLITMLTADNSGVINGGLSWSYAWLIIGLPVVLCVLKGLYANFKNPGTGASLLPPTPYVEPPAPPAEEVAPEAEQLFKEE